MWRYKILALNFAVVVLNGCYFIPSKKASNTSSDQAPASVIESKKDDGSAGAEVSIPNEFASRINSLAIAAGADLLGDSDINQSLPLDGALAAGSPINVSTAQDLDATIIGTLTLEIPYDTDTALQAGTLAVLYHVEVNGKSKVGILFGKDIAEADGKLKVHLVGFGSYQPIRIPAAPTGPVEAAIEKKPVPRAQQESGSNSGQESFPECSKDGETDCIANSSFKAVAITILEPENIRKGITIAGVVGAYPSADFPLPGASAATDLQNFATQITTEGSFEYWDSSGIRHTGSGDSDLASSNVKVGVALENLSLTGSFAGFSPDPWDVRYGITVGSTTGKLKVNCRNMVGDYDKTDGLSTGISGINDPFSNTDDYNNTSSFPSTNPWGSDEFFCGFNVPSDPTWERVTTTPATASTLSVYKDKVSGLNWSRGTSTTNLDWDEVAGGGGGTGALEYCLNLDLENAGSGYGGITGWRLPTQKELVTASSNGIYDIDDNSTATDNLGDLGTLFWSSTTFSGLTTQAVKVSPSTGGASPYAKTSSGAVLCVSP